MLSSVGLALSPLFSIFILVFVFVHFLSLERRGFRLTLKPSSDDALDEQTASHIAQIEIYC